MRAILLLNPAAGRVKEDASLLDSAAWERQCEAAGIEAVVWSTPAMEIAEAARRAAGSDADCVIVAGGDGTVRSVAEVLAGGTKPLAVLPTGTLNHFARDLGMPLDLDEAIRAVAAGRVERIDVGEVNGRVFVNNSSVGLYSQMVLQRDALRPASRRQKFVAMLRASWRVLRRFPRFSADIQLDGGKTVARAVPLVLVSNNPYETGWPRLGRRSKLDRGRLGVYVVRCTTRAQLLWCAFQAVRNRLDKVSAVESFSASAVAIETQRGTAFVSLDGEVIRLRPPLKYRCRPGKLLVVRPALSVALPTRVSEAGSKPNRVVQ
jgi:diacylglycerol kinase family enzyme